MTRIEENIIEIAWIDERLSLTGMYKEDTDSMDEKLAVIDLAYQFEREHENVEWGMKLDYYEEIEKFATEKLLEQFGK